MGSCPVWGVVLVGAWPSGELVVQSCPGGDCPEWRFVLGSWPVGELSWCMGVVL